MEELAKGTAATPWPGSSAWSTGPIPSAARPRPAKITGRSFGKDRRLPITNQFRAATHPTG